MKSLKLISLILIISILLPYGASAHVEQFEQNPATAIDETALIAYLSSNPATARIVVDGVEIDSGNGELISAIIGTDGKCEATYGFRLSHMDRGIIIEDGYDGAGASYVTISICFNTSYYNNVPIHLLTSVSGSWAVQDPYVSVTDVVVDYCCTGGGPDGHPVNNQHSHDNHPPVYLGGFSYNTGYTSYIVELLGTLGAKMTLSYLMGTSRTWSFEIDCYRLNNTPWLGIY